MRFLYLALALILFPLFSSAQITLEEFGPSFSKPVSIKNAGDSRLFIVEQNGYIRILKADGTSPASPFLDITSKVETAGSFEKGFLGLAFHPNYSSNGYFYVHYTGADTVGSIPGGIDSIGSDGQVDSYIVRYTVSGNPDIADASSELIIMTISHPYDAHYGGDLAFGPSDGFLYISKGDGGNSLGDPDNRAQDLREPNGKILRIDVDSAPTTNTYGNNYSIPGTNPYSGSPDGAFDPRQEIWSYGLRNPAKFSFDSSGNMWIADTGQEDTEEINLNTGNLSSLNYGWSCYEGSSAFNNFTGCNSISQTSAVHEYAHANGRCAIIGGYRYQGSAQPALVGKYFFADWCSNEIFILTESGGSWTRTTYDASSASTSRFTGFGEDMNGELYVIGRGGSQKVHKIKQSGALSTNTNESILKFNLKPNPTNNGKVTLNFLNGISIKEINTYNLHGQNIKSNFSQIDSNTINLEFKNLSSGIYIIEAISTTGEKSQNKLIVK